MPKAEAAEEREAVREVVVRRLAALRREGLIDRAGRGRLVVRDLKALRGRPTGPPYGAALRGRAAG